MITYDLHNKKSKDNHHVSKISHYALRAMQRNVWKPTLFWFKMKTLHC